MKSLIAIHNGFFNQLGKADFLAPLLLRIYLAPVLIQAGWNKIGNAERFENTAAWFGNPGWGLGLPMPEVMTALAGGTELFGGILLLLGLGVRVLAIPMMVTMLVAIFAVHWDNGWLAISDASSWLANDRVLAAAERKEAILAILREQENYHWLTGKGSVTILNNGIEFAATYFIMLLSLMFTGGGRFVSLDYWLCRRFCKAN